MSYTKTSKTFEHVQPNGMTFLAVCSDLGSSWAKARDPISAIRDAYNISGRMEPTAIRCIYGKNDEIFSNEWGSIEWKADNPPIPVGFFKVTKNGIKPLTAHCKAFPDNSQTCEDWIE